MLEAKELWILSSTCWNEEGPCPCSCLNMRNLSTSEISILFDAWKNGFCLSHSFLPFFFAIWSPILQPLLPISALRLVLFVFN